MFISNEKSQPIIRVVASIVILVTLAFLFSTLWKRNPPINLSPNIALGQVMAEETAKLLSNTGEVVIVISEQKNFESPFSDTEIKSFKETLEKGGVIKIVGTELMPEGRFAPALGIGGKQLLEIIEKYPGISAVVSFIGPPILDSVLSNLDAKAPKIIVYSNGMPVKNLLEQKLIQLAIVFRSSSKIDPPKASEKTPKSPREWFDRYYRVATPETAAELHY